MCRELGKLICEVGMLVTKVCDKYVARKNSSFPEGRLLESIQNSSCHKVHYNDYIVAVCYFEKELICLGVGTLLPWYCHLARCIVGLDVLLTLNVIGLDVLLTLSKCFCRIRLPPCRQCLYLYEMRALLS